MGVSYMSISTVGTIIRFIINILFCKQQRSSLLPSKTHTGWVWSHDSCISMSVMSVVPPISDVIQHGTYLILYVIQHWVLYNISNRNQHTGNNF